MSGTGSAKRSAVDKKAPASRKGRRAHKSAGEPAAGRGRPQTVSDEQILQMARQVLAARGAAAFRVAEVARELGVSPSAICQRFDGLDDLKAKIVANSVERFRICVAEVPETRDGGGLLALALAIGAYEPARSQTALLALVPPENVEGEEGLFALHVDCMHILREAVAARMPQTALSQERAVSAFVTYLAGCVNEWRLQSARTLYDVLADRIAQWLELANIPFTPPPRPARKTRAKRSEA